MVVMMWSEPPYRLAVVSLDESDRAHHYLRMIREYVKVKLVRRWTIARSISCEDDKREEGRILNVEVGLHHQAQWLVPVRWWHRIIGCSRKAHGVSRELGHLLGFQIEPSARVILKPVWVNDRSWSDTRAGRTLWHGPDWSRCSS